MLASSPYETQQEVNLILMAGSEITFGAGGGGALGGGLATNLSLSAEVADAKGLFLNTTLTDFFFLIDTRGLGA